jgi:hypothetical protein
MDPQSHFLRKALVYPRVVHLPLDCFAMDDIDMKEEDINGDRQAGLYTPFL